MSRCCEGFENWQIAGYSSEEDYNNNQEFIREELLDKIDRATSFNEQEKSDKYGDDGYIAEIARNF